MFLLVVCSAQEEPEKAHSKMPRMANPMGERNPTTQNEERPEESAEHVAALGIPATVQSERKPETHHRLFAQQG
jgi:hypothetical protein